MRSIILGTATQALVVLLAMFSVYILLRGHNAPGGGFVGGLLAAAGLALYALAHGARKAGSLLGANPRVVIGAGLLVAAASGSVATLRGLPWMTAFWIKYDIPTVGKLGTVLLFDVGVYLIVLGTAVLILLTLTEESTTGEER